MKKILLILFAGTILAACGTQTGQQEEMIESNVKELALESMSFDGKTVTFDGIIGHTCQTSGDKMRVIYPEDTDFTILVMLGEFTGKITPEMEGNDIRIHGRLTTRVLNPDEGLEDDHDHDDDDHECTSTAAAIERLEARGVDPRIQTYVELNAYELI